MEEGKRHNLRLSGAQRTLQVMTRTLVLTLGEKGGCWNPSALKRIILAPVFRTDCWKGMGGNTQTCQEAFAMSGEGNGGLVEGSSSGRYEMIVEVWIICEW